MKILCLYNNDCALPLFNWLKEQGHEVTLFSDVLDKDWCLSQKFDLAVSYTYRYIIKKEVIEALNNNVVNLHNAFLPFNRGAAPNIWSIVDGTPRGVTLHFIDAELDKGYIIAQRLVELKDDDTLKTSYDSLDRNAIELFKEAFADYNFWNEMKKKPEGKGTYHSVSDTKRIYDLIDSFDIKVSDFIERIKNDSV